MNALFSPQNAPKCVWWRDSTGALWGGGLTGLLDPLAEFNGMVRASKEVEEKKKGDRGEGKGREERGGKGVGGIMPHQQFPNLPLPYFLLYV